VNKHGFSSAWGLGKASRVLQAMVCAAGVAVLSGCGGGGGGNGASVPPSATCSTDAQKDWLRSYMQDWYLWTGSSPNPDPAGYASVQSYFTALLYPGDGLVPNVVPADKWSYISDAASYTQFFTDGQTLGYGLFVNGLELKLPLKARFIEALSPAYEQGLRRGDEILKVNGHLAAELIAANDFSALSPTKAGDALVLEINNSSGTRTVTLTAKVYTLTPVPVSQLLTLPNASKVGYLVMKDFITQAEAPLATAFNDFRAAGARDVILDLRYNGGGRISTATVLASLVAGSTYNQNVFTNLVFNTKQASQNTSYRLASQTTGFDRVVVLTGARTCSASELVVNGLKPYVQVVTVGGQTCGKPFGFVPQTNCSSTFSAVNFESFNASGQGRYYNGIAATCPATDDFNGQLGDPTEVLTADATSYLQNGMCPAVAASVTTMSARSIVLSTAVRRGAVAVEPGERRGMWAD
jgi:hypothetical protein